MFENLSEKLQRAFKNLRGQGTITEENIGEALRRDSRRPARSRRQPERRQGADRPHPGARLWVRRCMTALSPTEQVIKIVRDELVAMLGKDTARFKFASRPPTVILMAGLQGSGKTTTSGKLAAWLRKGGHRPAAGLGRRLPSCCAGAAAGRGQRDQASTCTRATPKARRRGPALVERLAKEARREAINSGCDTLIVDTAGRLAWTRS